MNKSELLNWLDEKNQQWRELLDLIGLERMDIPGVNGEWSVKDIIAHLTGWNTRLVDRFKAAVNDEAEPPPPWPGELEAEDDINAWIYEYNHARSVDIVVDDMNQDYQKLIGIIESLPDDVRVEFIEPKFCLVWIGDKRYHVTEFFDHFQDDHEADIRAWLDRQE